MEMFSMCHFVMKLNRPHQHRVEVYEILKLSL